MEKNNRAPDHPGTFFYYRAHCFVQAQITQDAASPSPTPEVDRSVYQDRESFGFAHSQMLMADWSLVKTHETVRRLYGAFHLRDNQ